MSLPPADSVSMYGALAPAASFPSGVELGVVIAVAVYVAICAVDVSRYVGRLLNGWAEELRERAAYERQRREVTRR